MWLYDIMVSLLLIASLALLAGGILGIKERKRKGF